jgi:MFS family permease
VSSSLLSPVMTRFRYRTYMLSVLMIIFAFNATDRLALGLTLQSIKNAFQLTDTQLGLLTGIAFALFYSLMGVPISRWADRGDRIVIIALTTALWSIAVILCGFAASFVQLLLIRVFVAIGEAGCVPTAASVIADHYSREERPRAMALYFQGGALSLGSGYFLGGWLNQLYGWRVTFVLLGVPGVIIAVVAWCTLREPRKNRASGDTDGGHALSDTPKDASPLTTPPSLKEVCTTLWRNRTFRCLLSFYSVGSLFSTGLAQWLPAFFMRSYGMGTGELGTWIAVICCSSSMAGAFIGGEWAVRRAAGNETLQLRMMALAFFVVGVASVLMELSPNHFWALGWMMLWNLAGATTPGPMFAVVQTLVPDRMRATAVALLYLAANLIGMGLGPLTVGVVSDALRPWFGTESLRYTLLALSPGYVLSCWCLFQGSRSVGEDLQIARGNYIKDERVACRIRAH